MGKAQETEGEEGSNQRQKEASWIRVYACKEHMADIEGACDAKGFTQQQPLLQPQALEAKTQIFG
jgi:hypothetical protein